MASEYWKWKFRDVQPEEKRELTPEEKRQNWWDYHKWHIVIAVVLIAIFCNMVWSALHQVRPDYQIAYAGENSLPDDTAAALETELAALGEDLNGDGSVIVRLAQYTSGGNRQTAAAAEVRLMADLTECESYIFLLEDPEQFQQVYRTLCKLDGTTPEDGDYSGEGTYLAWEDCPVLAGLEPDGLPSRLYVARRGIWTEKTALHLEGCTALWNKITEGAEI